VPEVIIFAGLSIGHQAAASILPAQYQPPVSQGDVLRAVVRYRPRVIGIVDGLFESVPAVWHKEILWAMTQGVHVIGSAGIGALRAAELNAFGMDGVGKIFEAYRDGLLEDDDEVAVGHIHSAQGYKVTTEAMVNIRATIARAAVDGVVESDVASRALRRAKTMYFKARTYAALIEALLADGVPSTQIDCLRDWLTKGKINQMRLDAIDMLLQIAKRLEAGLPAKQVIFRFESSCAWATAMTERKKRFVSRRSERLAEK
jgi:hypothetical protein